jgi:hypothetical protein
MENDVCKLRVGPYMMHFTGYQPKTSPELEFCEDIPGTGPTIIVLDYIDSSLRDLPVEARIVRDTGSEADLDAITVYHKPAALFPRGSVVLEHTFDEPGRFVGLVTVGDRSRAPCSRVGTRGRRALILPSRWRRSSVAGWLSYPSSRAELRARVRLSRFDAVRLGDVVAQHPPLSHSPRCAVCP